MRYQVDIHDDDHQGQSKVTYCHDSHQHGTDHCDALYAAKDDNQRHCCYNTSYPCRFPSESLLQSTTNSIGLDGVVGESELKGNQNGE